MTAHALRSRNWFGRQDLDGFVHRSWLKAEGFSDVVSNIYNNGLLAFIPIGVAYAAEKAKPAAEQNVRFLLQAAQVKAQIAGAVAQRNPILERELFKFYFRKAAELPDAQKLPSIESRFGKLTGEEPWSGYDEQTVAEITSALSGADTDTAREVIAYEREHKSRAGVIDAATR